MADLTMVDTETLIAELLSRATFRGVLVRQKGMFKGKISEDFRWDSRNIEDPADILRAMADLIPRLDWGAP